MPFKRFLIANTVERRSSAIIAKDSEVVIIHNLYCKQLVFIAFLKIQTLKRQEAARVLIGGHLITEGIHSITLLEKAALFTHLFP